MSDYTLWDGDGLPDDDEDTLDALKELGILPHEVEALIDGCKKEAWVREKMAKYEGAGDPEWNLAVSRYHWRRAQRWKEILVLFDADE